MISSPGFLRIGRDSPVREDSSKLDEAEEERTTESRGTEVPEGTRRISPFSRKSTETILVPGEGDEAGVVDVGRGLRGFGDDKGDFFWE